MKRVVRSHLSERLIKRRKELDVINQKLLTLLNRRLRISLDIGRVKKEMGKKIHDAEREREILDGLNRKNRGPLKEEDLRRIFKMIMKVCRQSQIEAYQPSRSKA